MSGYQARTRPVGPGLAMAADVARWAWHGRLWAVLVILAIIALSVAVAGGGQAALPWLVYGGL